MCRKTKTESILLNFPKFILFIFAVTSFSVGAQNTATVMPGMFHADVKTRDSWKERTAKYSWTLNRKKISRERPETQVKVHWPDFDTIMFYDGVKKHFILTRLKPGGRYDLSIGCCAEGFDIHDISRHRRYDSLFKKFPEESRDSIRQALESARVNFEVKNKKDKDTLLLIYADVYACLASGKISLNDGKVEFGEPSKSFEADNKNWIIIAKFIKGWKKEGVESRHEVSRDGSIDLWCEEYYEICSVQVRFLHQEIILAIYDDTIKKLKLKVTGNY